MDTCRFEMQIKNTKCFQCAAKFGFSGWAYTWTHDEEISDPCIRCPIKIEGKPLVVLAEVKSAEFGDVAGKRIRGKDWNEIERRGYFITARGLNKK